MDGERARGRPPRLDLVAVAVPVLLLLAGAWSRRWVSDDGFINLRIVEQLWAGNGPVWNAGERVETGTSPLWLALLAGIGGAARFVDLEWVAVVLGITCALAGLTAAGLAARRLHPSAGRPLVPLGALVVAAVPAFWDFASSGLETGLSLLWLGVGGLGLVVTVVRGPGADPSGRRAVGTAAILGLGPLIRPDLALLALPLLAALAVGCRTLPRRHLAVVVLAGGTPAVAYQLFRMAYFAALVPNTAFAKEGGLSSWSAGWAYAADHVGTWRLWYPAAAVLVAAVACARTRGLDGGRALVIGGVVLGAVLHALYVVRVGGDFMHARLLLPATFALALPWAVVPARRVPVAAALALVPWAALAALSWEPPGQPGAGPADGVVDERAYYVALAGRPNPVTAADFARVPYAVGGRAARDASGSGVGRLTFQVGTPGDRAGWVEASDPVARFGVAVDNVGVFGYLAGPDVVAIDLRGLGDPVTSRFRLTGPRGRPGHEKLASPAWVLGRLATPGAVTPPGIGVAPEEVRAARAAVACGALADVLDGITDPLTPSRAGANLVLAVRTFSLRIDADPLGAAAALC